MGAYNPARIMEGLPAGVRSVTAGCQRTLEFPGIETCWSAIVALQRGCAAVDQCTKTVHSTDVQHNTVISRSLLGITSALNAVALSPQ